MDEEYDLCMKDLKSFRGCFINTVLFLTALIFTPIGLLGAFNSWGNIHIFLSLFTIGIMCSILCITCMMYVLIAYCYRKPPPRRRSIVTVNV